MLGKKKLGQSEVTKKYLIYLPVPKPLPLFSNRGEKTQAQQILSQCRKCRWHKAREINHTDFTGGKH